MLSNEDSRVALLLLLLLLLLLFLHQFFRLLSVLPLPLLEATKRSESPRPNPIRLLSNLLLLVVGVVLEATKRSVTEISVKNCVWGPVEWVGDQLTG